jgi:hypothetical protein
MVGFLKCTFTFSLEDNGTCSYTIIGTLKLINNNYNYSNLLKLFLHSYAIVKKHFQLIARMNVLKRY